jgi:hypothetical protein
MKTEYNLVLCAVYAHAYRIYKHEGFVICPASQGKIVHALFPPPIHHIEKVSRLPVFRKKKAF